MAIKDGAHFLEHAFSTEPKPMTDISGIELEERTCDYCGKTFRTLKPQNRCSVYCTSLNHSKPFDRKANDRNRVFSTADLRGKYEQRRAVKLW